MAEPIADQHPLVRACASTLLGRMSFGPSESVYDEGLGLWLDSTGSPAVRAATRPGASTKKDDVETGEDHKGT